MAVHFEACGPELQMDAWCAVNATVPFKHCSHLGRDDCVLLGPWARVVLPLPPGIEAAVGHIQLLAQPDCGKAVRQCVNQTKPLGGSCSLAKCTVPTLKKSFSILSSRFSLRSRESSGLFSLVS